MNRAEQAIGQGTTTNSKHWNSHIKGVFPTHIKASSGPYLVTLDNKKYLDFIGGLGTNLLGYGFPLVENEVEKYRHQGKSPSLPHILEVEVAEQLKQMFPWTQRWKFLKTGSEACAAAVRMARSYKNGIKTHVGDEYKKPLILSEGYHGWSDGFTSMEWPARGVVDDFQFAKTHGPQGEPNFRKSLAYEISRGQSKAAALITEPVMVDGSQKRIEELKSYRFLCDEAETLLIHDEVITGFRYKSHSVSKHYDIIPDLIVIGKGMANGYPLAAVGGPAEILDNDYFVSSTYAGEVTALAACKAVMNTLRTKPEFHIDRLWEAGAKFLNGFNEASKALGFEIEGYATRGVFKGNELNIALFRQEACLAGLLFGPSWFISMSHIPLLDQTLESCKDILGKMEKKLPKLIGEMPRSPFAMKARK
tara:strand:+ start:5389 stop:6648 length:1260 start_codon:yes stop_codon:yes gene_type:complete